MTTGGQDVWAEAEGGSWDDGSDAWSDNRAGRGRNEDVWAEAEGGGWNDDGGRLGRQPLGQRP